MAFTENLDQFFDTGDFAVEAILVLPSGATRQINAIFDAPTQNVDVYDTAIEADAPLLRCKTADVTGIKRGGAVSINSTQFIVERISHDGTGVSLLYLK